MRALAIALLITLTATFARAQTTPTTTLGPRQNTVPSDAARHEYDREKKSPGLAVTLETLCPIAGAGPLYVGRDGDKAGFLAVLSGVSGGAAAGSLLWLLHLNEQHTSGASRVENDFYQGTAITLLITSGIVYLLARASGISLASQSADLHNEELRQRLAAP